MNMAANILEIGEPRETEEGKLRNVQGNLKFLRPFRFPCRFTPRTCYADGSTPSPAKRTVTAVQRQIF